MAYVFKNSAHLQFIQVTHAIYDRTPRTPEQKSHNQLYQASVCKKFT